jgi:hypothetical protein
MASARFKAEADRLRKEQNDAVDRANALASRQALKVYSEVKEVGSRMAQACTKISGSQYIKEDGNLREAYSLCTQARNQIPTAIGALRTIGGKGATGGDKY